MIDLKNLTIEKAHNDLKNGAYTVRELCEAYLKKIAENNERLNVYRQVFDDVLAQADVAQQRFTDGTATVLTGIPVALKDNILIAGKHAGASSKILEAYVSPFGSTVVQLLKDAGVVFLGHTNLDEFAMGSSTEYSAYGVTKNPLDETRVAGGSSGGSAAAVAADMALAAFGTDTCGSIRLPAAFCGLVGLLPTYGAVSRSGIIAMGSSLDQVGPITKTVRDTELIFQTIAKQDPLDATTLPTQMRLLHKAPANKTIGVPRAFLEGVSPDVLANFNTVLDGLKLKGYHIVDISLPLVKYSLATYYIVMPSEVSSNLARYDGVRYGARATETNLENLYKETRGRGFGKEVRRRILLGAYILSHGHYDAYYTKALRVREQVKKELRTMFQSVDLIATPTTPVVAFRPGEKTKDPVAMYLADIFAAPGNIANIPAISIPSGFGEDGLPTGIQFMANTLNESTLFEAGKDVEQITK